MAGWHWNKGTVFLHSVQKSKMLEGAISRRKARLGRKQADPQSEGHSVKAKEMSMSNSLKRKQPTAKETIQDWEDIFMPELKDLADYQFRSELHRMMGSEQIRLSDKEWSHRFTKKLRENYMTCLDEKEKQLARNERKRLHRLRLAGILQEAGSVDPNTPGTGPPGAAHMTLDKAAARRKSAVEKMKKEKSGVSYFQDAENIKKEKELFKRIQRRTYAAPKKLPVLEYLLIVDRTLDPLESPEALREKVSRSLEMSTSTELAKRKKKRLPPEVAQLYQQQTVRSLYALARRLIPPLPKPPDPDPEKAEKAEKASKAKKAGGPSAFKPRR